MILISLVFFLAFFASKLKFEEDISKLIPVNEQSSQLQKVLKQVNFADKIIVNLKKDSEGTEDDLVAYADAFLEEISKDSLGLISNIQGKITGETMSETLDFAYNNLPLLLTQEDYTSIAKKLYPDSIAKIAHGNYKTLISPSGIVAKKNILRDPLGLTFMGLKQLQSLSFGDDFNVHNDYLISKDRNHILLFLTPKHKSSETDKNTKLSELIYKTHHKLNSTFTSKVYGESFGGALVAVANASQIKNDIQLTLSIALSILLIILILFYRKLLLPVILFIPTILGALFAVVVLYLLRESISAISLGIGSVLLGVTLDYALHVLTHLRSNNNAKSLYKEITKPILMSSLTTALAFLCLLFLQSQALQDLGIFAAISVLSASVFALIIIPQVYKNKTISKQNSTIIDKFASFKFHKAKAIIIGLSILICLSLFTYNKVNFNKDLNSLNYQPENLVNANINLDNLVNSTSKSVYISTYGTTEEEALNANEEVFNTLKRLEQNNNIIQFSSIGALVKAKAIQNRKIEQWNNFWNPQRKETLRNVIEKESQNLGFKPNAYKQFYSHLDKSFSSLSSKDYEVLSFITIEDYISKTTDFVTVSTLVKTENDKVDELFETFSNTANVVVIDRQKTNETFLGNLKNDFNRLVLYSFIVVLLILLIFYRSFSLTLVTIIPILLTWLITVGIMGLLNVEFNIFNIIISTFIFGLGVDYCIFVTNGLLHNLKYGGNVLPTYKTSILLSVITTILGVGTLIFAKHPALFSIALVSVIGILSAIIVSFCLQPLLFSLFIGSSKKSPISFRYFIHSIISFGYFGLGGLLLSLVGVALIKILPFSKKVKMKWFHIIISKFKKSVLYSNWFVKKTTLNPFKEAFEKQSIIIANHTSFLDILAIGMLHPKIIFLVNDWVYNSPIFGKAVKLAGFYPVSRGIDKSIGHLKTKIEQGYTLMAFPEGTRSTTNKIKRFHKGAFFLAEEFNLDIVPVLIHGNSEVLPKGSFVIKDGSITLKILERITFEDQSFGKTYKDKTKLISKHFKSAFQDLRNEIEDATYFHRIILEDYRYKGYDVYKTVKKDLSKHAKLYKHIVAVLPQRETITHISKDYGQLSFLLALDQPDRKVISVLRNNDIIPILENSFITNHDYKLNFTQNLHKAISYNPNVLIVDYNALEIVLEALQKQHFTSVILIKEACNLSSEVENLNYILTTKKEDIIILKHNTIEN
ncbi:1-acyl-sn-glycerol-3-phosphate acyltransferase [Seonamhaeicola marinus]|uniref:1-acyl-sn-glycerol-3-phosphate acyltransferase n=1 Tax=Seonamhaeicola marinus TaxID=1912246 RepID=UPI001FE6890B|nr:1-acyl-sn-glycerol-3-phosphate acyltransferase [Seonamhaeicola marinus]